jgi:predicted TIM-barrel fold metal-dependent hydrolase
MSFTRRDFLLGAAAGTASLAALEALSTPASAAAAFPLIDTHQHLWDMKTLNLPWLAEPDSKKIAYPHTMADYMRESKGLGIEKTIYMEVDAAESDEVKEADFVINTCKSGKTLMKKGVISGRPATPGFAAYAKKYQNIPYIQGFRQILHPPNRPKGLCLQPQFVKNIQLLGEIGKTYDICIRPAELADGYKLADLCPKTRFVLDHCGNGEANWGGKGHDYDTWAKGITEFAKRKNVICKMSGVIKTAQKPGSKAEQIKPLIHHVIQSFGPSRVIWASDWPVCEFAVPLREWVEIAHKLTSDLPLADQKKIFHDNAAAWYKV